MEILVKYNLSHDSRFVRTKRSVFAKKSWRPWSVQAASLHTWLNYSSRSVALKVSATLIARKDAYGLFAVFKFFSYTRSLEFLGLVRKTVVFVFFFSNSVSVSPLAKRSSVQYRFLRCRSLSVLLLKRQLNFPGNSNVKVEKQETAVLHIQSLSIKNKRSILLLDNFPTQHCYRLFVFNSALSTTSSVLYRLQTRFRSNQIF